jgi:phage FluMu protein Com
MRLGDLDALTEITEQQGHLTVDDILSAPTIDAVQVVRCRDCKHWGIEHTTPVLKGKCPCVVVDRVTRPDDFCSYGEKRGEG